MFFMNRKIVPVSLIVVLGLIVYANTLHVPFFFDDFVNIIDIPLVKNLSHFAGAASAGGEYGRRYFGYLTFALNYRFGGLNVTGYHLVNITIHLTAALLVYRLVTLTFRTPYLPEGPDPEKAGSGAVFPALLAALLFVAHPLQTQAVTYIVQRFASLSAMLYLLSLTCYIQARLSRFEPGGRAAAAWAWLAGALLAALLALATKETAFTLPFAILLYELMFFTDRAAMKRKLLAVACALPALALSGAALWAVKSGRPLMDIFSVIDKATRLQTDMSRWDYLATQCRVLVTYLRLVLFPLGQRLDYDYPVYHTFLTPPVFLSGALLCALFAVAVYCLFLSRTKEGRQDNDAALFRIIAFGIFFFFIAHAVESSVIPIVDVIFEHRMYLPSAGLFMSMAAAVALVGRQNALMPGWPGVRVLIGSACVVLLLAGLTVARNRLWRDEAALWEDNAWKTPKKGRVLLNLGSASERNGDLEGAESAYLAAGELMPGQPFSSLDLGRIYLQLGRLDDALAQFKTALAIDPTMAEVYNNMGKIHELKMEYDEALEDYRKAVKLKPYLAATHSNIGVLYARQKRYEEAIQEYDKAVASAPEYQPAYINRGTAFLAIGRTGEAIADFQKVLQINPANKEAAQLLLQAGQGR
jgi:protein O-mannosyl-transferase